MPEGSGRTGVLNFGWGGCIGCIWGSQVFFHAMQFVVGNASVSQHFVL